MNENKPSLGQVSFIGDVIQRSPELNQIINTDMPFDKLIKMITKQDYAQIKRYLYANKYSELADFLHTKFGFTKK